MEDSNINLKIKFVASVMFLGLLWGPYGVKSESWSDS